MVPHQCGGTDNCGGFNTQPPEGGWDSFRVFVYAQNSFNTQPPEGGWTEISGRLKDAAIVSTHSRPKAAGPANGIFYPLLSVSTHSRPKAAGTCL